MIGHGRWNVYQRRIPNVGNLVLFGLPAIDGHWTHINWFPRGVVEIESVTRDTMIGALGIGTDDELQAICSFEDTLTESVIRVTTRVDVRYHGYFGADYQIYVGRWDR